MANKYCDSGAYPAYSATPTGASWPLNAQDGDGTASGAATASICSIVFSGIPTTGTITVLGASVSTTGVIGAASADAAANTLATNINATTNAVTTANFINKSQLRNHVYARGPSGGAPSGTCQIMTRQGSAAHAGQTAITYTLDNVNAGSSSLSLTGGSGGAWGYLANWTGTIWASAVAQCQYGVWAAALPYCGTLAAGDDVYIRTNNYTFSVGDVNVNVLMSTMGTVTNPVRFRFDNNSVWADGADKYLKVQESSTAGRILTIQPSATTYAEVLGYQLSTGAKSFQMECISTSSGTQIYWGPGGLKWTHVSIDGSGAATHNAQYLQGVGSTSANSGTIFENCIIKMLSNTRPMIQMIASGYTGRATWSGCTFDNTTASTAHTGIISGGANGNNTLITLTGCSFLNFIGTSGGSKLIDPSISGVVNPKINIINTSVWSGVAVRTSPFSTQTAVSGVPFDRYISIFSQLAGRDFSVDNQTGYVEWNSSRSFPTLSALLPDGSTPWSIHLQPSVLSGSIGKNAPLECPRFSKINTLSTGARTFRVNFCVNKNITTPTKADVSIVVVYYDGSNLITLNSYDSTGSALSTDATSVWSSYGSGADAARVKWNDGVDQFHNQYYLQLSTTTSLPNGSDVGVFFRWHTAVSAAYGIFVDPEVVIT